MSNKSFSKRAIWSGRILSGLAVLFLLFDGIMKFFMDKLPAEVLEAGAALQWPIEKMPLVGTILLICTFLYIIPRTSGRVEKVACYCGLLQTRQTLLLVGRLALS